MKRNRYYVAPTVRSLDAGQIVESLGPVSAGSGQMTDFRPNHETCGFPMGYACDIGK